MPPQCLIDQRKLSQQPTKKHNHLETCHQGPPKNSFLMHFLDDMVLDNYVHMCIYIYIYIYIYIWNICSFVYHKTYATHLPPCDPSPVLRGTQVEGFTSMVGFCILLGGTYKAYRPTHLSARLAMAVWKNALELGDVEITGEVEHQEVGWTTCENRWTLGIRQFFCWGINTIHESRNAHCENVNVISCWCVRSQWNCELWEPEPWLTWLLRSDPPQKEGMKMARNSTNDQGTKVCIQAFIFQFQPYGPISNSALRVWISLPFLVIALCPALSLCIIRAPRKSSATGRGVYSIGCGWWWRWRPTNMNVHPKLRLVYEGMGSMVLGGCQLEQTAKTTRTAVNLGQYFAAFPAPAKWITTRGVDDAKRLMSLISSFPSVHPLLSSWTHMSEIPNCGIYISMQHFIGGCPLVISNSPSPQVLKSCAGPSGLRQRHKLSTFTHLADWRVLEVCPPWHRHESNRPVARGCGHPTVCRSIARWNMGDQEAPSPRVRF